MAKRKRKPVKNWRVYYRRKYGRKHYSFISDGSTGRRAFANFEKTFPGITDGMVYVRSRRLIVPPVSRNPIKHMILGDLALHGISLLH